MTYTRKNVWGLGADWADDILWYARGVQAMKAKGLADPLSWRFYGAIHGFDSGLWTTMGYLATTDPQPTSAVQSTFWLQCQHATWYFLPWHRGYLLSFEAAVRAEVVALGGPADWALPYWNYFGPGQNALPPAFASADWPDGKGNNPLFTTQRYGPTGNGNVYVDLSSVNLNALTDTIFTGKTRVSPGFGGLDTGFSHGGRNHGGVEQQPHDMVHVLVGGSSASTGAGGLMTDPDTAGLDPIFYLHHANIDRLWQVWQLNPVTNADPSDPNWLQGPVSFGERAFAMPNTDGTTWNYTPADMSNFSTLNYTYDDLTAATVAPAPSARLATLGMSPMAARAVGVPTMQSSDDVELVGATEQPLSLASAGASATVRMDRAVRQKVSSSLTLTADPPAPDRVFLNIENVRSKSDSAAYHVYVGLPPGALPGDHPEALAGSVALFGVRKSSLPDSEHGGEGLTFVLDISHVVDAMHLNGTLDVDTIPVQFVPITNIPAGSEISVGRISMYRQGQ